MEIDRVKQDLIKARKNRDEIRSNVLRLLISEYELELNRNRKPDITQIINKLVKSNNESLSHREDPTLREENKILSEYLPKYLSDLQIHTHIRELNLVGDMSKDMGTCMKYFKGKGLAVRSEDVRSIILSKSVY